MRFRGFWGRVRRGAVAAFVGAAISVLGAELVAFALLDIAFQNWARIFYALVYLAGAGVLLWLDDDALMKVYRHGLSGLFAFTGSICLLLMYSLQPKSPVPALARVAMFSLVGMTLCISVVLSCFVIAYGVIESCCERGECVYEVLASPGRIVCILFVALVEGTYYGFVLGILEHRGQKPAVILPHNDTVLALPMASLLGGLAGARIEWLRQASENCYATIQCIHVPAGPDDMEAWLDYQYDEELEESGGAGIGSVFDS